MSVNFCNFQPLTVAMLNLVLSLTMINLISAKTSNVFLQFIASIILTESSRVWSSICCTLLTNPIPPDQTVYTSYRSLLSYSRNIYLNSLKIRSPTLIFRSISGLQKGSVPSSPSTRLISFIIFLPGTHETSRAHTAIPISLRWCASTEYTPARGKPKPREGGKNLYLGALRTQSRETEERLD